MAEELKNNYNKAYIQRVAFEIKKQLPSFKVKKFIDFTFDPTWIDLELKGRMKKISRSLYEFLPSDYNQAIKIILKSALPNI